MTGNVIKQREIQSVRTVIPQQNGPGHSVGMVLEPGKWSIHDPFLLLAEDWFQPGTFDVHPHRGIETVTYVIEGTLNHFDNNFGEGDLQPGDVQWMTAGRGVIHKEDPAPGETVHSLQLWVNLPREDKLTQPRYQNLRGQDMPVYREDGAQIRIFSGSSHGITAPTKNYVPVTMVEVTLESGATVSQDLPKDYNGFLYILEGSGWFGASRVEAGERQVLLLEPSEAQPSEITIQAKDKLQVLIYAGLPVREPVVAYGPFVMNTKGEIKQAFEDYQSGKFGR